MERSDELKALYRHNAVASLHPSSLSHLVGLKAIVWMTVWQTVVAVCLLRIRIWANLIDEKFNSLIRFLLNVI